MMDKADTESRTDKQRVATPDPLLTLPSVDDLDSPDEVWIEYDGPFLYTAWSADREWLVLTSDIVDVETPMSLEWPQARFVFISIAAPLSGADRTGLANGSLRIRDFWKNAAQARQVFVMRTGREEGITRLVGPMPEKWLPTHDADVREYMPTVPYQRAGRL